MRRQTSALLAGSAASVLAASLLQGAATAMPPVDDRRGRSATERTIPTDMLPNPLADKQAALRDKAIELVLKGRADIQRRAGGSNVVRLGRGQFVEVSREASDTDPDEILTFLSEFGNRHKPGTPQGIRGPRHNQIPRPDRNWNGNFTDDNETIWQPNFNRGYYLDLMFGDNNSMADFYKKQSSGLYAVAGDVSPWGKVPFRESRYGYNRGGNVITAEGMWAYIDHAARAWYQGRRDDGMSRAEIRDYLARFDQWDRYDHDGDGNFDEADGYIDHFQAVHAGIGEETGAPGWAIWSHRFYSHLDTVGTEGPAGNPLGGTQIGRTGFWIGDYTTEPENGGLGVFAHEYGHDLGLADYYDTAGGENSTSFWTLMSSGSYLNPGRAEIGSKPGYMGPHEKLLLGWLDYAEIEHGPGTRHRVSLGVAGRQTGKPQALAVVLPDYVKVLRLPDPPQGQFAWWSTQHDESTTTLSRQVTLPANDPARLTFQTWYNIEDCQCDYAYVRVDGEPIRGNITRPRENNGITGKSGGWVQARFDLSDWAGQTFELEFAYVTDPAVQHKGFLADAIKVTSGGSTVFSDGAESGNGGWTVGGFKKTDGVERSRHLQYYLAENRQYVGYDRTLKTGPYHRGHVYSRPFWVTRFPFQNGLLIWHANSAFVDNNTSEHPGRGLSLPVDAAAEPVIFENGLVMRNRSQPFDATFGTSVTDPVTFREERLKQNGDIVVMRERLPARHQKSVFDDSKVNRYWDKRNPWGSAKVAGSDTRITVLYETSTGSRVDLRVVFE